MLDPFLVAAEFVARMQDRRMLVREIGEFVQAPTGQLAQTWRCGVRCASRSRSMYSGNKS